MDIIVAIKISDQEIDDIITTALEGGINYWAESALPLNDDYKGCEFASEVISKGGTLLIKLLDPHDGNINVYPLTLENLKKGIETAIEKQSDAVTTMDAESADMIIQYALFGELIYG